MIANKPVATQLYMANLALVATHEIDSAYWHEWDLFSLPGGIQLFLIVNLALIWVLIFGFSRVVVWSRGARLFSYVLSGAGIFAFLIHMIFIVLGYSQFLAPVSIGLLIAILIVSVAQVLVVATMPGIPYIVEQND